MRTFLFSLSFLFALYSNAQEVTFTVDTLTQKTYMITGRGGNIGIYVGTDHVFMVDDQFAPLSKQIKNVIATLTDKPISYLVNTHMHGDHTGGNSNFNSKETTLVAHNNVREKLKTNGQRNVDANRMTQDDYEKSLPEITFTDGITFYDNNETIMAIHVHNAHTDGDAMVYFVNENVLHMGDTYFSGRYPFIDLNNGGSLNGYIDAHKKALIIIDKNTKIIPGHGRPSNKKELEIYVEMLKDLKAIVQKEIDAGKSLEQVKNNTTLFSKYDASHGGGFINPDRMRETVYLSLVSE